MVFLAFDAVRFPPGANVDVFVFARRQVDHDRVFAGWPVEFEFPFVDLYAVREDRLMDGVVGQVGEVEEFEGDLFAGEFLREARFMDRFRADFVRLLRYRCALAFRRAGSLGRDVAVLARAHIGRGELVVAEEDRLLADADFAGAAGDFFAVGVDGGFEFERHVAGVGDLDRVEDRLPGFEVVQFFLRVAFRAFALLVLFDLIARFWIAGDPAELRDVFPALDAVGFPPRARVDFVMARRHVDRDRVRAGRPVEHELVRSNDPFAVDEHRLKHGVFFCFGEVFEEEGDVVAGEFNVHRRFTFGRRRRGRRCTQSQGQGADADESSQLPATSFPRATFLLCAGPLLTYLALAHDVSPVRRPERTPRPATLERTLQQTARR